MGLCVAVMCDCWKKGKTKPIDFPEYIVQKADELELNLPEEILKEKSLACSYEQKFNEWIQDACEHEFMWKLCFKFRSLPYSIFDYNKGKDFPIINKLLFENHTDVIPMEMNKALEKELTELASRIGFEKYIEEYNNFMELIRTSEETGNPLFIC